MIRACARRKRGVAHGAGERPGRGAIAVVTLGVILCSGCGADRAPDPGAASDLRPNIILITIESLRADHVSCYGYERATTPALDELASVGIVFDSAYSVTSWTLTSHASVFTGLYPAAHRVVAHDDRLDDSHTTLAEVLQGAGYQTAGFVSGPFLQGQHNLHQGFETYDESPSNSGGNQAAHSDVTNPVSERLITRFLKEGRSADRPFFLFAYLWDPHYDYLPPTPFDRSFLPADARAVDLEDYETRDVVHAGLAREELDYVISQYDGEILWTDGLLGRLWALLRDLGLWDDTVIVVTADHGEEFFEHGSKGHRNNLYEESVHVPLVVKTSAPNEPRRDARNVSLVDLYPTILELAGIRTTSVHHGRSLLDPDSERGPVFFELKTEWLVRDPSTDRSGVVSDLWLAVREGDYKLVLERNEGRHGLYDLTADPGETTSLITSEPERYAALDGLLGTHLEAMKRDSALWDRSSPVRLRPEQEERLRSLGYVGRSR